MTSKNINACTLVKWKTPEDELLNVARVAQKLAHNRGYKPKRVCVAAPNDAWILQFLRACKSLEIPAVICLPCRKLKPDAALALAKIDYLACASDEAQGGATGDSADNTEAEVCTKEEARKKLNELGVTDEQCNELTKTCAGARGFTLMKLLGMTSVKQFAHILKIVDGDEDIHRLKTIVHEQLVHPCVRQNSEEITITSIKDVHGQFDFIFYIGCVEGLDGVEHGEHLVRPNAQSEAESAVPEIFLSYFTRVDKRIADQAHIFYARCKDEAGLEVAMCKPASFIESARGLRPSTTSGQGLLNIYGLT